jgi:hypothetical protein
MIKRKYFIHGESVDARGRILSSHFRAFETKSWRPVAASNLFEYYEHVFLAAAPAEAEKIDFKAFNRI